MRYTFGVETGEGDGCILAGSRLVLLPQHLLSSFSFCLDPGALAQPNPGGKVSGLIAMVRVGVGEFASGSLGVRSGAMADGGTNTTSQHVVVQGRSRKGIRDGVAIVVTLSDIWFSIFSSPFIDGKG